MSDVGWVEPVNSCFEVACLCGGDGFLPLAHEGDEGWPEVPVSLRCAACGSEHIVFDDRRHGYDGALGHNSELEVPETEQIELLGDEIGEPPYRVVARFEYPSDTLGDEHFAEWKGREVELYSWFTLVGRPMTGDETETIFESECA